MCGQSPLEFCIIAQSFAEVVSYLTTHPFICNSALTTETSLISFLIARFNKLILQYTVVEFRTEALVYNDNSDRMIHWHFNDSSL